MSLPSYRGDIINGPEFTEEARVPDPNRLVRAYNQSAATMNLLRAFTTGGYAGLDRVSEWNLDFMKNTPNGSAYQDVAARVDESLQFMKVRLLECLAIGKEHRNEQQCETALEISFQNSTLHLYVT